MYGCAVDMGSEQGKGPAGGGPASRTSGADVIRKFTAAKEAATVNIVSKSLSRSVPSMALVPYSPPPIPLRPVAMRDCPPGMRIRGGRPIKVKPRLSPGARADPKQKKQVNVGGGGGGEKAHPDAKQKKQVEVDGGGGQKPDADAERKKEKKKKAGDRKSASLGDKRTLKRKRTAEADPVRARPPDADLAPELLSSDKRTRVKYLVKVFDDLRRQFLAEDDRGRKQDAVLRAYDMLKPYQPYDHSLHGEVPGVKVGDHYRYRWEMFMISLHRQPQAGIDYITAGKSEFKNRKGDPVSVATSVIASGGYEDDDDRGDTLIYTGSGGNNNKGSKLQSKDQDLERGNLALKNSCDLNLPVRVIRGKKVKVMNGVNNLPSSIIYYYDGLYDVAECYQEKGSRENMVWKYKLLRQPGQGLLSEKLLFPKGGNVLPPLLRERGERVILEDIARGVETLKIRVVGCEDGDKPPSDFTYIPSLRFARGVPTADSLASGPRCSCLGTQCSDSSCSCEELNGEQAYNDEGSLLWAKRLVYECGPGCRCSSKCINKVVQKGLRYDMEVFRTKHKGWGVRSRTFIPQGSFICEYVGEVIHNSEAEKLIEQDEYLFDLKIPDNMERRFGHDSGLVVKPSSEGKGKGIADEPEAVKYTIDAREYGNIARFINHSCHPNLFVQCVLYDHHDHHLPHIALFTQEHIAPYKELTYDYGYELDKVTLASGKVKAKKCRCLAKDCRGRLY